MASTTVMLPASISVISARYRPRSRSAGSPMSTPATIVIRPASSRISGYGWVVANSSRAADQAPMASTATWPRETRPTRPTSTPSATATIEYTATCVIVSM